MSTMTSIARPAAAALSAGAVAALVGFAGATPAAAAGASHYYLGHSGNATQCLYVGPAGSTRTIDYASFTPRGGHNFEWVGSAGSGWQPGHQMVLAADSHGHPALRRSAPTAARISGSRTVVFQYSRAGRTTVTSPKLHGVSWMTYAKAGCPTE